MSIRILPQPKLVREPKGTGRFRFPACSLIVLGPRADDSERLAAAALADAVAADGVAVDIERHGKLDRLPAPIVEMLLLGRDERLSPGLAKLAGGRELGCEGYALEVTPKRVRVAAKSAAGLFYGAQTLIQMLEREGTRSPASRFHRDPGSRLNGNCCEHSDHQHHNAVSPPHPPSPSPTRLFLPACRIVDWPDFKYRGLMLDVSRFRVPTMETLADLVFRLAACKINVLQLYVEHTFRCRRHPEYSDGCSPLTAEELSDLDQLCRSVHIELQANQNSLGHLEHLLRQPEFSHLAERTADMPPLPGPRGNPFPQPWSFRLDREEVYRLLDDIYAEHLAAVRSPLVNLGCDEVWDMGTGRSKEYVARKGKIRAFVDHVKRIAALARRYGKQTMIWDDMVRHNPEVLRMLPKDIIPVFWHYERDPEPRYEKIWANCGRRHWVAPGCCGWQTIFAQHEKAAKNLRWMTAAGRAGGAEGVLNTEWGDHGNFQTLASSYWSMALGAELSWNVDASFSLPLGGGSGRGGISDFRRRFARAWFDDREGALAEVYVLLAATNTAFRKLGYQGMPFALYWADFPHATNWSKLTRTPSPPQREVDRCRKVATIALSLARQVRRRPPGGVDDEIMQELISAAEQTILACRKATLAAKVRAALEKSPALPDSLKRQVAALAADWSRQRGEFERVWMLRNRRGQIDYRLGLYDERAKDFAKLLRKRRGSDDKKRTPP
ncbi:MAG: glycoside hydrolase family 20 zincin-like fold domain-containing protein [Phycisphaerae bacterium]|nr:glycoside hydrolase family 20 zincin-like fold domain-containing protein [Phycisphaerae bacterium]